MSGNRHSGYIDLGILQMQILWLLNRKDTHGYELMKNLNEIKKTKITQGTLYPALQRLEELNLIKSKKGKRKIIYSLTSKGKKIMSDNCIEFCHTFEGIFKDYICHHCK